MNTSRLLGGAVAALLACGACAQEPATAATPAAPEALAPAPDLIEDDGWKRPRVGIHVGSHHWPDRRDKRSPKFKNFNPGMNARWDNGITAGFYKNSENRWSVYGGWTWTRSACGLALTVGVITGYEKGTMPMVVPSLCVFDNVRLTVIPPVEPKGASVLHLSLEF